MKLEKISESIIYDNPMPILRSRHSCFPYSCERDDGTLLATHVIGEAFESVDGSVYISESADKGLTFSEPRPMQDKGAYDPPLTESLKMTNLGDGHLYLFGYAILRENPDLPISNGKTGGVLPSKVCWCESFDHGRTFSRLSFVDSAWGPHTEASAPVTRLENGDLVSPIGPFPQWDGTFTGPVCSRLMRSRDGGRTWEDGTVIMSLGENVTMYEQRLTVLEKSRDLVVIAWNENMVTGERLNNHFALSHDQGHTFEGPFDTGVHAQSSSVCAIGGDRLVSFHAARRDTDDPRVFANIVNLAGGKWDIEHSEVVWRPDLPIQYDNKMADVFNMLKFGQPGGVLLRDGTLLFTQWIIDQNQGKTMCMRFRLVE